MTTRIMDYETFVLRQQKQEASRRRTRLRKAESYLNQNWQTYHDPHDAERSVLIIGQHRKVEC